MQLVEFSSGIVVEVGVNVRIVRHVCKCDSRVQNPVESCCHRSGFEFKRDSCDYSHEYCSYEENEKVVPQVFLGPLFGR